MTFRMCTKCSCWEHVKQSVPVLAMFLTCSYLFPGTLASSVREEAISPAELISIDIEGDGGGDRLTREAGSTRRFGSLTTPRTRGGSVGRSLVVRRGDGGRFPMNHAEDVVHTGRRVFKGHASVLWVVVLVGVAEWGMMGTCQPMSSPYMFPTSAQQYSIIPTFPPRP